MENKKLKSKNLLIAALLVSAVFFFIPEPAHAIALIGPMVVTVVVYVVLYLLQFIGSLLFSLAGYLVSIALNFNFQVLDPTNAIVGIGWEITRDVANLGFVLIIIVIALATIFRYQSYGAKKLLPKLIGAAILVNFSLTIAGTLIGFSHIITRYFFKAVTESGSSSGAGFLSTEFTQTLSGAFDPQALFTEPTEPEPVDPEEEVGGLTKFGTSAILGVTSLFFVVIFIFIATFVLFAFAFMMLIRYIYLSILLVLAPLSWLFWVIPSAQGMFTKWWKTFMQWVFFAPAVSFFFYLALVSIRQVSSGTAAVSSTTFFKNGMVAALMQQGVRMIILVGLLVGGLIVAQQMSITGAAGAHKMLSDNVRKGKQWMQQRSKEAATRAATAPLRSDTGQKAIRALQNAGNKGFNFNNIPGLRGTGLANRLNELSPGASQSIARGAGVNALGNILSKFSGKSKADFQKKKDELGKQSIDEQAGRYRDLDDAGKAAVVSNIAEEGKNIAKELVSADVEIARANKALLAARTNGDQVAINAAEERKNRAIESKAVVQDKQSMFEDAVANLPPGVRSGLAGGNAAAGGTINEFLQQSTDRDVARRRVGRIERHLNGARSRNASQATIDGLTNQLDQARAQLLATPVSAFDIANIVTRENGIATYRNKKARRYIATIEDKKTGRRKFEHRAGK